MIAEKGIEVGGSTMGEERTIHRTLVVLLCLALANTSISAGAQQGPSVASPLSDAEKEEFLRTAKVVRKEGLDVGVTLSERATLDDVRLTHDAHIQTVDEFRRGVTTLRRSVEVNFRDSYKFNIAAYRLDRLINLNMVPVSVERRIGREKAAVTWWVDDVQMMERDRHEKRIQPPDSSAWNDQMYNVRVFNELVYNTDPNQGNLLITNDWQIRLIDYTRGFRTLKLLRRPQNLTPRIDRRVYEGLQGLDQETLTHVMDGVLTKSQIEGILARRDLILEYFDGEIAQKGEASVICDLPGH